MDNKRLPLMEIFGPTIQGEGSVIGQQTYFIRLGLCDYKCEKCDSMHAVDPLKVSENAEWLTQAEILSKFLTYFNDFSNRGSTNWITLSGGNPAIHDLTDLVFGLKEDNFRIAVETQGTFAPDWLNVCDVVTVSPKGPGMGERFDPEVFLNFVKQSNRKSLAVKIVVFGQPDIDFASHVVELLKPLKITQDQIYLSQGNPFPPGTPQTYFPSQALPDFLRAQYLHTFAMLRNHPTLSKVKFLPQWHVWLWGNQQGV